MHDFNKGMRNAARAVIFTALFILIFVSLSRAFALGTSTSEDGMENRISRAYRGEDKDSLDVVFVGNSDVYRAVSPIDLYHYTGITSAVCGKPGNSIKAIADDVRDVLKYQHPKVLVLETDCMFSGQNPQFKKSKTTKEVKSSASSNSGSIGTFLSKVKNKVNTLDNAIIAAVNFYFPLMKYHGRWNTLDISSFINQSKKYYKFSNKGMAYSNNVKPYDSQEDYMSSKPDKPAKLRAEQKQAFDEIYGLCTENDIRLVLFTVPSANTWNNDRSAAMQELADEYGLTYYDYNIDYPEGFDWSIHTKDGGNHLNYDGALTVTRDFGNKLLTDLGLTETRLSDEQRQQWDDDYRLFHKKISTP